MDVLRRGSILRGRMLNIDSSNAIYRASHILPSLRLTLSNAAVKSIRSFIRETSKPGV